MWILQLNLMDQILAAYIFISTDGEFVSKKCARIIAVL
jgi:hypothetical protein